MKPSLFRSHFLARLQRRRTARHFLRHFSFELFRHAPVSKAVPPDLAQAVLLVAARYHEDRSYEGTHSAMPFGVSALIERWRAVRVLGGRGNSRGRA